MKSADSKRTRTQPRVEHAPVTLDFSMILLLILFRCWRLGLTVLAYLWQREQDELSQGMVDAGLVAIIIKVAGIGLMEKHLGKTLAEIQPTLVKSVQVLHYTMDVRCD